MDKSACRELSFTDPHLLLKSEDENLYAKQELTTITFHILDKLLFHVRGEDSFFRGKTLTDSLGIVKLPYSIDYRKIAKFFKLKSRNMDYLRLCMREGAAAAAKSLQSCPTLCDPIDDSPPGSSVHGIFQARVLEWGAIAFSDA